MSRIPPALARRIDRLARAGHRFHRFAHHPLCGRYEGEVVRIGRRTRVCRGCVMAWTGGIVGLGIGLLLAAPMVVGLGVLLGGVLIASGSLRRRGQTAWRPGKTLTRLMPLLALAFAAGTGARLAAVGALGSGLGLFGLATGAFLVLLAGYKRRGPDRTPCLSCPEKGGAVPCSGVRPMVRRERAIQRLAGRWLDGAGL